MGFRIQTRGNKVISRTWAILLALALGLSASAAETPPDALLFSFEKDADLAAWAPVKLAEAKSEQPAPKIELSSEGATSGKSCLKITFAGGQWPTVGTSVIPVKGTWKEYQTVKAHLTVDHDVIAYFGIGQGKQDVAALKPQWQKTLMLRPGRNEVALTIRHGIGRTVIDPKEGEITSFVIGMFQPAAGEVLRVDNVRVSADWPAPQVTGWYSPYNHDGYSAWSAADYERTKTIPRFEVLGTDLKVASYEELSKMLKPSWKPASDVTLDQDPDFANCYYYAKGKHWKAVSGMYYGQDPDFFPIILLHGPASAPVTSWDFTAGLKFWIEQGHENHGFFLYGDSGDYMRIYMPNAKDIRQRPAIWVVYTKPGPG
jgi:hypothetical protein